MSCVDLYVHLQFQKKLDLNQLKGKFCYFVETEFHTLTPDI